MPGHVEHPAQRCQLTLAPHQRRALHRQAEASAGIGRLSDAIGRLGQNEFGVVAPSTNERGAVLMAMLAVLVLDAPVVVSTVPAPTTT